MHPMIMLTSRNEGLIYLNGVYQGEIRKDAPLMRPVSPFGAVNLEFKPFLPMALSTIVKIVFSNGKPVRESIRPDSGMSVVSWPFGITEIALSANLIHSSAPYVKTLAGAGRMFKYIKTPAFCYLETEFQGRISAHGLPKDAQEPVFAEGEGVLYVSGTTEEGLRYALVLTQTGEHLLLNVTGKEITFLPGGKIRVIQALGDLAGHETEEIFAQKEAHFEKESAQMKKNPTGEFRSVTPVECAVCAAEAVIFGMDEEFEGYLSPAFHMDEKTREIISRASGACPLRFTPPDGRSAIAVLYDIAPGLREGAPVYYKGEMIDGEWKIIDMKAW
ncbi:MAG: hypothetical protein IKJ65_04940 [Clostridia bacterium]|nr:hypothetical protein [Clostridia bacterium]